MKSIFYLEASACAPSDYLILQPQFGRIIPVRAVDDPAWAPAMELHVSRKARERYQFDHSLFTSSGGVIFANFYAARQFALKMNLSRDLITHPEEAVSAADLNAIGLIDEIFHNLISLYRQQLKPGVFGEALERLLAEIGARGVETLLTKFVEEFPPIAVYLGKMDAQTYLSGATGGTPNRQIALEELLLLWLHNSNPALEKYRELFDDSDLRQNSPYLQAMSKLEEFFEEQPPFGPGGSPKNLIQLLRSPALQAPYSLTAQLQFMRMNWGLYWEGMLDIQWELLLGEPFVEKWGVPPPDYSTRFARAVDFMTEEQKVRFNPGLGPAPTHVPDYAVAGEEPEKFSVDLHWMPRLVLIAKSTLVWLDQLSRQYGRAIRRLDEIPGEELELLAARGFTGLWLIGLWERSPASRTIKRLCGNPEAESSAYALYDYQISKALGGDEAFQVLKERCWKRGIRLASDMVPNHTGIVSHWVYNHPERYLQLPYSPFPAYSFNGPNLSDHPDVAIYLEDHYYDRTDAAVVFKRVDRRSGETRYIYHGNDGTSMPWNDTAQLDYTRAEVREAVIQTILKVARQFPIIRFDAAMTLAKRHYQRLWFPQPGSGGDIPSRAELGLTREQFDALMPVEFWREVVDRVAAEAPDTLLLAEAFWMMEGYFVRSLGMHRVYNSAFMNMLKNEENHKYRQTIKKTLEFEPEVLKRYVNFISNPDEETAINQFGDGDKYFGVCMMMATMPGLPMFGHGQFEGFREKYGMEYHRAYLNEQPNEYLVQRHLREIVPLLKKRYLFAEVENFLLYDFYLSDGTVNENVFAYSNRYGSERSLVVFNNSAGYTRGWIRTSAAFSVREDGGKKQLVQHTIGEGLQLQPGAAVFCRYRDHIENREYLHNNQELWQRGLYCEIGPYQYHVFLDFEERRDDASQRLQHLCNYLQGRGVPDLQLAAREMYLRPVHHAFRNCLNPESVQQLTSLLSGKVTPAAEALKSTLHLYRQFLETAAQFAGLSGGAAQPAARAGADLQALGRLMGGSISKEYPLPRSRGYQNAMDYLQQQVDRRKLLPHVFCYWIFLRHIGELVAAEGKDQTGDTGLRSSALSEEWLLFRVVQADLQNAGFSLAEAGQAVALLRLLIVLQNWSTGIPLRGKAGSVLSLFFEQPEFQNFVRVNRFDGILWFEKEAFETALVYLFSAAVINTLSAAEAAAQAGGKSKSAGTAKKSRRKAAATTAADGKAASARRIAQLYALIEKWRKAENNSQYQVELLIKLLQEKKPRAPRSSVSAPSKPARLRKTSPPAGTARTADETPRRKARKPKSAGANDSPGKPGKIQKAGKSKKSGRS